MPSLSAVDTRFLSTFIIIEGGVGTFQAIINEPGQGEVPSFQFNLPRRLMRLGVGVPVEAGMVVRDQFGAVFMLGKHGASESRGKVLFKNFRLFEATDQFTWRGRGKEIDPTTRLERDAGEISKGMIWGVYEPETREAFDRQMRSNFETGRLITNRQVLLDDLIDDKKVTRVDEQLGLYIATVG